MTSNDNATIVGVTDYDTIVLSGASSKGLITLGAIQYAYDNYMLRNLKNFIGTSSGAIICFLLIIGYTPVEIIVHVCTNQLMEKMQNLNVVAMIQGRGASSYNHIQEQLEKMTIAKLGYLPTLKDLKDKYDKNLVCITHNLTTDVTEYLNYETHPRIPCITALRMSSNLPLIFEQYKYGESLYIDGGISDNFGIDVADKIGKRILGIVLYGSNTEEKVQDMNAVEFIYKLMFIPIKQSVEYKIKNVSDKCKIIRLNSTKYKFFNFDISSKNKLQMFSNGYKQMQKACT